MERKKHRTWCIHNPSVCSEYIAFMGFLDAHHTLTPYRAILKSFLLLGKFNFNKFSVLLGFAPVSREVSQIADSNSIVICWFQGVSRSIDGSFSIQQPSYVKNKPSNHQFIILLSAAMCMCAYTRLFVCVCRRVFVWAQLLSGHL